MHLQKNFDIVLLDSNLFESAETAEKIALGSEAWTKKGISDTINANGIYFAATKNGNYAGHGGMTVVLDEAYITNIVVAPTFRRMGAARQILDILCATAKEKGAAFISLEVRESNIAAINLYEKKGFKTAGVRKNFYKDPTENAVIMTCELQNT